MWNSLINQAKVHEKITKNELFWKNQQCIRTTYSKKELYSQET